MVGCGVGSTVTVGTTVRAGVGATVTVGTAVGAGVGATVTAGTAVDADFDSALTVGVVARVGLGTTARVGAAVGVGVRSTTRVGIGACWCSAAGVFSASRSDVRNAMAIRTATAPTNSVTTAIAIAELASPPSFNSDLSVLQAVQKFPVS